MAMYGTLHMYTHERCEITCEHQLNERRPEGYPVLSIGTLTVYPTRERLERLNAVISAYLAAHAEPDESADRADIMPMPAEAATGDEELPQGWRRCPERGHLEGPGGIEVRPSQLEVGRWVVDADGDGHLLQDSGGPRFFPDESAAIAAATGAVVDADELLSSMASSYEVRRGGWEDDPSVEELEAAGRSCPGQVP